MLYLQNPYISRNANIEIFLDERAQEDRKVQLERDIKRFKEFQNISTNGQYSRNPVHSILEGNRLSNDYRFKEAISKYEQAKTLDSVFSLSAGYN